MVFSDRSKAMVPLGCVPHWFCVGLFVMMRSEASYPMAFFYQNSSTDAVLLVSLLAPCPYEIHPQRRNRIRPALLPA
ncbi:hypothetical protein BDF14DRAFT_1778841 [Spinellus fusiger]|nr:hypothetical protein BDF14DRAFT_1778841 [Spinellus fusiger]